MGFDLSFALERLDAHGYACFESVSLSNAVHIGQSLGFLVPSVRGGSLVDELTPTVSERARPKSLSSLYGQGAFPFHTDSAGHPVPPHYLLLRLREDSRTERPTFVLGLNSLNFSQDELLLLCRDVWIVNAGRGRFLTSILSNTNFPGHTILRYDTRMMRPAHEEFRGSFSLMQAKVRHASAIEIRWQPGMLLLIDNWRMMHSRGESPIVDENRVLQRVLVADRRVQ